MRKMFLLSLVIILLMAFTPLQNPQISYDKGLVEISTAIWKNDKYIMVNLSRQGERIKAKYFAARDYNGNSVFKRYKEWQKGKGVILVTSGTYMNENYQPVGLTIDNGLVVNNELSDEFDGLVIVYATGGVVVSNIKEGNLSIKCNGENKNFDIRDQFDKDEFVKCAEEVGATVFQTHLLAYKNNLIVYPSENCKLPPCARERRFLAVCKDEEGTLRHVIVHSPTMSTLYDGSSRVLGFLKEYERMKEVVFMINLDTGYQDVFELYDSNGKRRADIKGQKDISIAINLLTYYYE